MVVMVTGAAGQLGHDVINELAKRGHKCFGTDIDVFYRKKPDGTLASKLPYCHMDVSSLATVDRVIDSLRLDAVIHCAAFSDIDEAENPENYKKVIKTNVKGAENVAVSCKKFGVKMLYVSSDSVYGGKEDVILDPDVSETNPVNAYGQSKLAGEKAVMEQLDRYYIVRTQWLYGMSGDSFVSRMLKLGENNKSVKVDDDLIGTPTYTYDLARLLVDMVETEEYGIYHAVNEGGYISRADFVREIYRRAGLRTKVIPVHSDSCGFAAARPKYAKLGTDKLRAHRFRRLPPWDGAIGRYLKEIRYPTRIRGKLPTKEEMLRMEGE